MTWQLTYPVAQLDPRPQGAEANNQIFRNPLGVLGIEVTVPELAARCQLGNLDHHGPGTTAETPSAAEQAMVAALPRRGSCDCQIEGDQHESWCCALNAATLATVRADPDSVAAMAVFELRSVGEGVDREMIAAIGRFDRLGPAGPHPAKVVALARIAGNIKPLEDRVWWAVCLLRGDVCQEEVDRLVAEAKAEFEAAREASKAELAADGRVAVVVSTHRHAMAIGYEAANVVVALNPAMPVQDGEPIVKFTIARFDSHVPCDIAGAAAELNKLEAGWGGRGDIAGSPQGVSSALSLEQVVEVVTRHLK